MQVSVNAYDPMKQEHRSDMKLYVVPAAPNPTKVMLYKVFTSAPGNRSNGLIFFIIPL